MQRQQQVILMMVMVLLAGTLFCSPTAGAADTIKMGVAGAHSGDLASYGIPTVKAAELVVKKFNRQGWRAGKAGGTGGRRRSMQDRSGRQRGHQAAH
jgi:hypothetical protein